MSRHYALAAILLGVLGFCTANLLAPAGLADSRDANGQPDLSGTWTMNLTTKNADMTGNGTNSSVQNTLTITITQDLANISIDLGSAGGTLTGNIGANHFHASGTDGSGANLVLSGSVKGKNNDTFKGIGLGFTEDALGTIKFSAKKEE